MELVDTGVEEEKGEHCGEIVMYCEEGERCTKGEHRNRGRWGVGR